MLITITTAITITIGILNKRVYLQYDSLVHEIFGLHLQTADVVVEFFRIVERLFLQRSSILIYKYIPRFVVFLSYKENKV